MAYLALILIAILAIGSVAHPTAAATLEKINVSHGAISGSIAQTWVAKEAKLFEKHGLDVNLVYISGGPRSIMSLIGGVSPEEFIEPRCVGDLESSGFLDEMTRQYGK